MNKLAKHTQTELISIIESNATEKDLWIFDCDGTLIHGDIASLTAWALIRFGLAHPELLPPEYDEYKELPFDYLHFRGLREKIIRKNGISSIYEWECFLHAGLPPKTSYDTAKFAVSEGLKDKHLAFTNPLAKLAEKHRANSWIVSGSPDMCVWAVADELKIPHDRVIGTKLETVDGIYANRIMEPGIVWEDLKRVALESHGVSKPFFVAGDTIGDWAMFEMSQKYCWCIVWGKYRHRGEEFRENIEQRVLKNTGISLPHEPGFYSFEDTLNSKTWIFEILSAEEVEPTSKG